MPSEKKPKSRLPGFFVPCLLLFLTLPACEQKKPEPHGNSWDSSPAFWIWNETSDPPPNTGHRHYLQVAEFTRTSLSILQSAPLSAWQTAVVRLPPGRETLDDPDSRLRLFSYLKDQNFPRVQIDYDCAALNLGLYRKFLQSLRAQTGSTKLSITALASWIDAPGFEELAQVVDEITPMFYDLEVDEPAQIRAHSARPLIDVETLAWIKKWQRCPTPWRAGLPNYQRLSLFTSEGLLVGHLQQWQPSDLAQLSDLTPIPGSSPDSFFWRIDQGQIYRRIALPKDHLLLWRCPGESITRRAIATAKAAGAGGLIWFAHPDSAPVAWHSLTHLVHLDKDPRPSPDLKSTLNPDGSVSLSNLGPGDLPFSPQAPPWQLILEAQSGGVFSSPGPGTFDAVKAPGSSLVRPEVARTIVLTFSHLRSGSSLSSTPRLFDPAKQASLTHRIDPSP